MFNCPTCENELVHNDTFGSIEYLLFMLGAHARNTVDGKSPAKDGNIYLCKICKQYYYVYVKDPNTLLKGYPC